MRILTGSKLTAGDVREAVALARGQYKQDIYLVELTTTPRGAVVFYCESVHGRFATNRRQQGSDHSDGRAASWTAWGYLVAELYRRDPRAHIGQYKDVTDFRRQCQEYGPYRARYGDTLDFLELIEGLETPAP